MTTPINVIHSYPNWLPQTQTWMFNQVKYLPRHIHVDVVCETTENLDQFGLPNLHVLNNESQIQYIFEKGLRHFSIVTKGGFLRKKTVELKANIVHSHFGNIGWNNQVKVKSLGIGHIVTFYGWDVNMLPFQNKKWFLRYQDLFKLSDRFLCEGPFMASSLIRMGANQEKTIVHHLGVDTDSIAFIPRKILDGERLRVLIAASFVEKKGIPYALKALAQVSKKYPLDVTIIGDASPSQRHSAEKKNIMSTVEDCGLQNNVKLLGFQPYSVMFAEAYKNHIFISPSIKASDGNTEGGAPVSIIEMIATGMPVISTTHCDIPEVVQYGKDDWLVAEKDVTGLAKRMFWLIENPQKWEQMLILGRKHIEKEFNAVKQGERLAMIYQELM